MRSKHRFALRCGHVLLALLLALAAGAREAWAGPQENTYPYRVGATVGMVADIVKAVAEEKAAVTLLIGAGLDPHVYNPTRGDVAALLKSDIIFYAGLLLEGQMANILVKVSRRRPVYAVTERLQKSDLISDAASGHHDPHVWMDVGAWARAVTVVADALCAFDPPHAALYRNNARQYRETLRRLDAYAARVIGSIAPDQRILVTAHDAFNYMGRAYGIKVVGIQGLSTESEAGLKDINRLVDLLVQRRIPAVFVETSVSDKNVRALIEGAAARGHHVIVGGALFSDAMGPAGTYTGTYVGMIDHNVTTIARALGGTAPAAGMLGKLDAGGP